MSTFPLFYYPPIRFFVDWISQKEKTIDIYENYQKQTYRNRCYILSPNGVQKLIVPIEHDGSRVMKDLKVSYAENWQKEHFKSLEAAYRRSPYFEYYEDSLCSVFNKEFKYLIDLNINILEQLLILLQTENKFSLSEAYVETEENDFRSAYNAKEKVALPEYTQVFSEKMDFQSDLSILDLLFNEGPQSILYIKQLKNYL
ncbi:WbqC family protein [Weeksellaceae bacterium TAE3-ERU29]|nr:WbqC family protein [Weeksellaceae bacterium TAE3-ERU29]